MADRQFSLNNNTHIFSDRYQTYDKIRTEFDNLGKNGRFCAYVKPNSDGEIIVLLLDETGKTMSYDVWRAYVTSEDNSHPYPTSEDCRLYESGTTDYELRGYPSDYVVGAYVDSVTSISFPVFRNRSDANYYAETGDDSNALNYDDLHGAKCTIYITNNGDRISFNTQPVGEDVSILLYTHIVVNTRQGVLTRQFNIPTVGTYSTSWGAQAITPINNEIYLTITIYNGDSVVANFENIKITRALFGIVGSVGVTPPNGEQNGYSYTSTTDNSFDEIGEDGSDNSNATGGNRDGSEFGGFSNMLATYEISKQALSDLGSFIWNNSIFDDIKNLNNSPLENVVSLMYMPVSIGGDNHSIVLGNITTNVSGQRCPQNMKKVEIGSFSIPFYNTGFLNYEPYTSIALYLPLVGMVNLQPKDVIGQTVTVEYAYDVVVGSFGVFVYTSKGGGKTLIYSSQGTCAITIPLTASNQAQVQASILSSGVGLVSDALTGNDMGALNDAANILTTQNHSSTFGSASSMIGALSPSYCYYIIRTPITSLPSNFAHSHGWLCMQSFQLSSLKGFTVIERIELDGLYAMDEELQELKQILTTGFYL